MFFHLTESYSQKHAFFLIAFMVLSFHGTVSAQLTGSYSFRVSQLSNFEFGLYNSGVIWGNNYTNNDVGFWPRGTFHFVPYSTISGPVFLAQRGGRLCASDAGFYRASFSSPFNQMVPGYIGDPKARGSDIFHKPGWLYVDDPDYIIYTSLDYDSNGVDLSGNNYNDWPIRWIGNRARYVPDPLSRYRYPPAFCSDEDFFTVFKDTDTRADQLYNGPTGKSIPIGAEFHFYVYTWGSGPGKDIAVFRYDIVNKSGEQLDSCYFAYGTGLSFQIRGKTGTAADVIVAHRIEVYGADSSRNLTVIQPINPSTWYKTWTATPVPPTVGYPLLETPIGYSGKQVGLKYAAVDEEVDWFPDQTGKYTPTYDATFNDSIAYHTITHPQFRRFGDPTVTRNYPYLDGPVLISGPFPMQPNDTARFVMAYMFSDSLPHLLLMHDFLRKVYNSGFKRPLGPRASAVKVTPLDRHMKITWDTLAESSTDPIIPDSLGKPFKGYRLLRALKKEGPFKELGRWTTDSGLVHEYIDYGTDIGGLKNNVQYYYRLLSFDEGAKLLKLDPMESPPVDGVNAVAVIPETPASSVRDLNDVKIVPNPYIARHEAQRGEKKLFFNYLPEVCTIRIYTVALDLVKTIHHNGGTREEWDLRTDGGQYVASQMLYAYIETADGKKAVKKFGVVVGK